MFRLILALFLTCLSTTSLQGALRGKADLGPTYVHIDILENGKTVDRKDMGGVKGDLTLLIHQGLYVKPSFILAWNKGKLASGSLAMGYYIPVKSYLKFMPHAGVTFGYLSTKVDIALLNLQDKKERFRSISPFLGMEICFTYAEKWTFTGIYQFAWSRTHTKIKSVLSDKGRSCGSNYSFGIEYSITDQWAVNAGIGFNESLSKEKHGIRAKGAKIGLGYYF